MPSQYPLGPMTRGHLFADERCYGINGNIIPRFKGSAARFSKQQQQRRKPVRWECLATLCFLISEQPHLALTKTTSLRSYFIQRLILSGYKIKTE